MFPRSHSARRLQGGALLLMLACLARPPLAGTPPLHADFSGSWEMNYARSETARDKVEAINHAMQRAAEKRANNPYGRDAMISAGGDSFDSIRAMIPYARLAEQITASTIVEITQTDKSIRISGNEDFPLECDFAQRTIDLDKHPFGSEVCGWDGRDLIVYIELPDGLKVQERLTISANRSELRIVTTVVSGRRSKGFSLEKYFYRFEPPQENYDCEFTLTRGNVCNSKNINDTDNSDGTTP